jgi:hypothetical protein
VAIYYFYAQALKRLNEKWRVELCSQILSLAKPSSQSPTRMEWTGTLAVSSPSASCRFRLLAEDDAFGELRIETEQSIHKRLPDAELIAAPTKLKELGVDVLNDQNMEAWFQKHISQVKSPQLIETTLDAFWFYPWMLWFLMGMIAEVFIRRIL